MRHQPVTDAVGLKRAINELSTALAHVQCAWGYVKYPESAAVQDIADDLKALIDDWEPE